MTDQAAAASAEVRAKDPLEEIWKDDLLRRRGDAKFLETFLVARSTERAGGPSPGSFVLEIDAEWGVGKSFFLDRFAQQLRQSGHLVAVVNAWKDDHLEDPFVAIVASIDEVLSPYKKTSAKLKRALENTMHNAGEIVLKAGGGLFRQGLRKVMGKAADEIGDILDGSQAQTSSEDAIDAAAKEVGDALDSIVDKAFQAMIDDYRARNASTQSFRENLGLALRRLSHNTKLPLFVLVDELDRCRPSYAVALLERVKHLFDVPNVVFVFATNADQLRHSISGAYGQGFDGGGYLHRFFDRTYKFDDVEPEALVAHHLADLDISKYRAPLNDVPAFFCLAYRAYGMNPRQFRRAVELIKDVTSAWTGLVKIELTLLFPLVMAYLAVKSTAASKVSETIPIQFKTFIGKHRSGERAVNEQLEIKSTFEFASAYWHDLEEISLQMQRRHEGPASMYRLGIFENEVRQYSPGTPSLQSRLPYMVMAAGRLRPESRGA